MLGHPRTRLIGIMRPECIENVVMRHPLGILLRSKKIERADMLEDQLELIADALVPSDSGHGKVENRVRLSKVPEHRVGSVLDLDRLGKGSQALVRGYLGCFPRGEAFEHLAVLINLGDFAHRDLRNLVYPL